MLTMILVVLVLTGAFRVYGFTLRLFGRIIGWLIGMAIVFSIIGGMFGLIGALAGAMVHALPVILLVALGILIGRSLSGGSNGSSVQDRIRMDNGRNWTTFHGVQRPEQEILDANGRVIR